MEEVYGGLWRANLLFDGMMACSPKIFVYGKHIILAARIAEDDNCRQVGLAVEVDRKEQWLCLRKYENTQAPRLTVVLHLHSALLQPVLNCHHTDWTFEKSRARDPYRYHLLVQQRTYLLNPPKLISHLTLPMGHRAFRLMATTSRLPPVAYRCQKALQHSRIEATRSITQSSRSRIRHDSGAIYLLTGGLRI